MWHNQGCEVVVEVWHGRGGDVVVVRHGQYGVAAPM